MSDIIYTPPASGGGGTTINPNNSVIPVRFDATTFIDSNIENDVNNYLKTSVNPTSGDYFGLFIDFLNYTSILGDFDYLNMGTSFYIDDGNEQIYTKFASNILGLYLDFGNAAYALGDFGGVSNSTNISINDSSQIIDIVTDGYVNFKGSNFLAGSSGGNSGQHLVILVNGNQYKIRLELP